MVISLFPSVFNFKNSIRFLIRYNFFNGMAAFEKGIWPLSHLTVTERITVSVQLCKCNCGCCSLNFGWSFWFSVLLFSCLVEKARLLQGTSRNGLMYLVYRCSGLEHQQ